MMLYQAHRFYKALREFHSNRSYSYARRDHAEELCKELEALEGVTLKPPTAKLLREYIAIRDVAKGWDHPDDASEFTRLVTSAAERLAMALDDEANLDPLEEAAHDAPADTPAPTPPKKDGLPF